MRVHKTKDYSKFKEVLGNRSLSQAHVSRLKNSISTRNMLEENPILVSTDMYVIDGQHRLEAARKLGVPIYYTVIDGADIDEVLLMNANLKAWGMMDYVNCYAELGSEDYVLLRDFVEKYRIPVSVSASLLSGHHLGKGGGEVVRLIRNGTFKAGFYADALEFADRYVSIRKVLRGRFPGTRDFVHAVKRALDVPGVVFSELLRKISLYKGRFVKRDSSNEYLRDLEKIYNLRSRGDFIRFF